ncbi:molecular chaperone DnaJ, partial [Streptococcus pneumoniae]
MTILKMPLMENNTLRKSLQTTSALPCRIYVTDFVSRIYNLKT